MPTVPSFEWRLSDELLSNSKSHFIQATPFWKPRYWKRYRLWPDLEDQGPPRLIKSYGFDQEWRVVLDNSGCYVDEDGRKVTVQRRNNAEDLSEDSGVYWAAHNAAKFCVLESASMVEQGLVGYPPHIIWCYMLDATLTGSQERMKPLIIPEITRLGAQEDNTMISITTASQPNKPKSYIYPRLREEPSAFRLAVLRPSKERHADIICGLRDSSLDRSSVDKYEALSYAWGDPSKRKSITVNGQQFQATETLEAALRNLRYRDTPRVLWIDSICINQNDLSERKTQVQQMDRIYSRSQRVIVWLGQESDDSTVALQFMRPAAPSKSWRQNHSSNRWLDWICDPNEYPSEETYWDVIMDGIMPIYRLIKRPWFRRIWCIQEFILGQNVIFQCGQITITLEYLERFFLPLRNPVIVNYLVAAFRDQSEITTDDFMRSIPNVVRFFFWKAKGQSANFSVLGLLSAFCEWEASDPRDKVFGLYSLVGEEDGDRDALKPDYTLSTAEVYTNVAIFFLQKYRNLEILSIATQAVNWFRDVSRGHFLPSWVPDWRRGQSFGMERMCKPIAFQGGGSYPLFFDGIYNASLGLSARPVDFLDYQVLLLDGIKVDTIDAIGNVCMGYYSMDDIPNLLNQWQCIAGLLQDDFYRFSAQTAREAWWRTILADVDEGGDGGDIPSRCRIPPRDPKYSRFSCFPPSAGNDVDAMLGVASRWGPPVGRRFFKTSRGLFGLAPAAAQRGDDIVVLFGGGVPFVMRDYDWHYIIGESYVHGIMDGEVIHQPRIREFQDLKVHRFSIV